MVGIKTHAYDIEAKNADGVTIYYRYYQHDNVTDKTRVCVTYNKQENDYIGKVVIPEYVYNNGNELKVVSIGRRAFYNCPNLTDVIIPNSVAEIERLAFAYSGITSITIPSSVKKIGNGFAEKIYDLNIFYNCSNLTAIKVDSGNPVYDSRDNCNAVIETATNNLLIGCKNTNIPNTIISIGDFAFAGCSGLTSINIPNSVKK